VGAGTSDGAATTDDGSTPRRRRTSRLAAAGLVLALSVLLAACQPTPPPTSFTFAGSGWGHGVGMSQYGALGMAEAGRSYVQILAAYYPGTSVVTRTPTDDLRVLVAERRPTLTFVTGGTTTFGTAGSLPSARTVAVTASGANLRLTGALDATVAELTITFSGPLRITEAGNSYRYGHVVVRPDPAGGVRAVVAGLTMDQYLYGLAEMPASWHAQALRAQAVAARTFAQRRRDSRAGSGLDHDLVATVADQVYAGTTREDPRWSSAVDATTAKYLTYNGGLADAVYSSSNGGHSESSAYVWGGEVAYLQARPDSFDGNTHNPYRSWTRTYSAAELGAWFGVGTATSVSISGDIGASGRVNRATVRITGTKRTRTLTGNEFRNWINLVNPDRADQLLSTKFIVK